jgi:hypothetical protein
MEEVTRRGKQDEVKFEEIFVRRRCRQCQRFAFSWRKHGRESPWQFQ